MENVCIIIVLSVFILIIFILLGPSHEYRKDLIASIEEKESILRKNESLNKQWDILIEKRSLALKELNLEKYKKIDSEIEIVTSQIKALFNKK
jgi:hypothetical protein